MSSTATSDVSCPDPVDHRPSTVVLENEPAIAVPVPSRKRGKTKSKRKKSVLSDQLPKQEDTNGASNSGKTLATAAVSEVPCQTSVKTPSESSSGSSSGSTRDSLDKDEAFHSTSTSAVSNAEAKMTDVSKVQPNTYSSTEAEVRMKDAKEVQHNEDSATKAEVKTKAKGNKEAGSKAEKGSGTQVKTDSIKTNSKETLTREEAGIKDSKAQRHKDHPAKVESRAKYVSKAQVKKDSSEAQSKWSSTAQAQDVVTKAEARLKAARNEQRNKEAETDGATRAKDVIDTSRNQDPVHVLEDEQEVESVCVYKPEMTDSSSGSEASDLATDGDVTVYVSPDLPFFQIPSKS